MNLVPEETGFVVKADCVQSIFSAMASLVSDPRRRLEMGRAARHCMEDRSFEAAFNETWDMYGRINAERRVMNEY
jgi:hypothetical protein